GRHRARLGRRADRTFTSADAHLLQRPSTRPGDRLRRSAGPLRSGTAHRLRRGGNGQRLFLLHLCATLPPRLCFLAALVAMTLALAAPVSSALAQQPQGWADAASPEYKQHMDNGVKLYQDKNYEAAIAEFTAAYRVKAKASPLLNISLCHKALFQYPKAIEALETALSKHGDTMEASDKKAAQDAIAEMRALLAYGKVEVRPPNAIASLDGA